MLSLFFVNTKFSITKDSTNLDLTFLRSSVLYLSVNRLSKVYSSVLYIDLWLVLMITGWYIVVGVFCTPRYRVVKIAHSCSKKVL
jgi:hypothetical protein